MVKLSEFAENYHNLSPKTQPRRHLSPEQTARQQRRLYTIVCFRILVMGGFSFFSKNCLTYPCLFVLMYILALGAEKTLQVAFLLPPLITELFFALARFLFRAFCTLEAG